MKLSYILLIPAFLLSPASYNRTMSHGETVAHNGYIPHAELEKILKGRKLSLRGKTKDEVRAILGEPLVIEADGRRWLYEYSRDMVNHFGFVKQVAYVSIVVLFNESDTVAKCKIKARTKNSLR